MADSLAADWPQCVSMDLAAYHHYCVVVEKAVLGVFQHSSGFWVFREPIYTYAAVGLPHLVTFKPSGYYVAVPCLNADLIILIRRVDKAISSFVINK